MNKKLHAEVGLACQVTDTILPVPLQPSEQCCGSVFIRNPEPQIKGNDFVFQFDLFSFFDRVKVQLPSLNLKANYSCVIFILTCPG